MACHLRELRQRYGFSVKEIAEMAGTTARVIANAEELGERPGPELEQKIAKAIGFRVDLIFQDDKPQTERIVLPLQI